MTLIRDFTILLTILYMPHSYGWDVHFSLPLALNTKGAWARGLVTSLQGKNYMSWIGGDSIIPAAGGVDIFTGFNYGIGFGYRMNAQQALKIYLYRDSQIAYFKGSVPAANRYLRYQSFTGGVEFQSPHYRASINCKTNYLRSELWKSTHHTDPLSDEYDIAYDIVAPVIPYYDLLRAKFDLIDIEHVGCNAQVEWHSFNSITPYLSAYYTKVLFQIPIAGYQYSSISYYASRGITKVVGVGYDFQFSKPVLGIQVGAKLPIGRYVALDGQMGLNNFYGRQGSIGLNIDLFAPSRKPEYSPLAYCAPMRQMGPISYACTTPASQWKRPHNKHQKIVAPQRRKLYLPSLANILGSTKLVPPIHFNAVPAMRDHLLKMAQYTQQNNELKNFGLSKSYLQDFLEHMPHLVEREAFSRVSRKTPILAHYCNSLSRKLNKKPFETIKYNLKHLGNGATSEQLRGIQFFVNSTADQLRGIQFLMNAAHLFHTLEPGSAFGIIRMARGKLSFIPCQYHRVCSCKSLPLELSHIIIDKLLLGERNARVIQLLDQRYHDNSTDVEIMRNLIINTLV